MLNSIVNFTGGRTPAGTLRRHAALCALTVMLPMGFISTAPAAEEPEAQARPEIVFCSRSLGRSSDSERDSVVRTASRGRLQVLDSDGGIRTLVDATLNTNDRSIPTDVLDPDVSYDAGRVVFPDIPNRNTAGGSMRLTSTELVSDSSQTTCVKSISNNSVKTRSCSRVMMISTPSTFPMAVSVSYRPAIPRRPLMAATGLPIST